MRTVRQLLRGIGRWLRFFSHDTRLIEVAQKRPSKGTLRAIDVDGLTISIQLVRKAYCYEYRHFWTTREHFAVYYIFAEAPVSAPDYIKAACSLTLNLPGYYSYGEDWTDDRRHMCSMYIDLLHRRILEARSALG